MAVFVICKDGEEQEELSADLDIECAAQLILSSLHAEAPEWYWKLEQFHLF